MTGSAITGLSPAGTNCNPTGTSGGTGTANCFPRIQQAAMQAIADAATDTSNPALLGAPLPRPLTCIHIDGNPDLQTFFSGAVNANGISLDVACESYYPGWHGPLTKAQQDWHRCNTPNCTATQHIAADSMANEANGLGLPIFTIEDGVSSTTQGSPPDPWYGVNPPGPNRVLSRQGMIDLNKVEENIPHHLSLGMEWWAGEATNVPGGTAGARGYWTTPGVGVFDPSTTANSPADNATLPAMTALGGRLDPTLAYRLVNAADGKVLETPAAATTPGAALGTAPDTGITGPQQEWRFFAQGADPEQNATTYPTPMDHRGDGYFQIANGNQTHGLNVLAASGAGVVQSPQTAAVTAIAGTDAGQEWDVLTAGNCGDVPANCANPPQTGGDYYVIVNKATGLLLARTDAGAIALQAPAAPSNGDWIEPANQGQLWRIAPARVTQATIATTTAVVSSAASSFAGQPVTFTATVAGGSPLAGDTVTFKDGSAVLGAVTLSDGQTVASLTTSALTAGVHTITAEFSGDALNEASSGRVTQAVSAYVSQAGGVSGTVPATLALTLAGPASFGTFTPGVDHVYEASTTADVVSTAGDATLTVSDPGHLVNGTFALPQPLQVLGVPKIYSAPVSHDVVTIGFRQPIAATDALRTGTYSTTLTFTLSTTNP
jgi:hypothetical protein